MNEFGVWSEWLVMRKVFDWLEGLKSCKEALGLEYSSSYSAHLHAIKWAEKLGMSWGWKRLAESFGEVDEQGRQ
jgi:hypothetical protein